MTITEAAAAGILRLQLPAWRGTTTHVVLSVADGRSGPWLKFYCEPVNGCEPVILSTLGDTEDGWVPYDEAPSVPVPRG